MDTLDIVHYLKADAQVAYKAYLELPPGHDDIDHQLKLLDTIVNDLEAGT